MTASELLRQAVASVLVTGVFVLIYLFAARAGQRFISRMALQGGPGARAATLWSVIRRVLLVVLSLTGLLTVASAVWELPLTPLIALGSAVGIAVGLGAQRLIQDVVAGFFLLLEDQYRIGDTVTLANTSGDVEEIRLRVTVLRDVAGNVHYVPNGEIRVATNMTRDYAQVVLDITVGFETDVDRIIAVLGDEMATMASDVGWTDVFLAPPEILGVDQLRESGVVVRVSARVRAAERWRMQREALRRIKKRLDLEEIALPWNPVRFYRKDGGDAGRGDK
jgi:small conductance mechanosensitive channel